MHVSLIVNPVAGPRHRGDTASARTAEAVEVLRAEGVELTVSITAYRGHAHALANDAVAAGANRVVAWGGDGTVNEVAAALAGRPVALGIVPAGSGNGLARELGVPRRSPADALRLAVRSRPRPIDVGEIGGRAFVNVAGLGVDARIARRFNARRGRSRGLVTYAAATVAELLTARPVDCVIETGSEHLDVRASVVVFANSPQYGNGARIAPGAILDDGELDLVLVASGGAVSSLWRARRLFDGSVLRDRHVTHRRVRCARVVAREPVLFHVDGEPVDGPAALDVRVAAGALLVAA